LICSPVCLELCICYDVKSRQFLSIIVFVAAYSGKLFESTVLAVNCTVHTLKLKYEP